MSSWLQRRKSPRPPSSSPQPQSAGSGQVSSGSVEVTSPPVEVRLRCDDGGLKNPLDWGTIPLALKQKFPHWKETTPEITKSCEVPSTRKQELDVDRSIHYSSSFKPPDYTIPYMVMERDTINSIAIKFETTPSDIARINRKHQGPSFLIFPGDVIYVPDIENMPKVTTPPPPAESPTTPKPSDDGEEMRTRQVTPLNWSTDAIEEVEDTHLSIICKFISEDQGCIHGSLVVNHMTMMFTPHTTDPLVQEIGTVAFEIVLPLSDITYAALTKDVTPPIRRSHTENSADSSSHGNSDAGHVTSESSMELTLSLDKVKVEDEDQQIPVIRFSKASVEAEDEQAESDGTGGPVEGTAPVEDGEFPSIKTIKGDTEAPQTALSQLDDPEATLGPTTQSEEQAQPADLPQNHIGDTLKVTTGEPSKIASSDSDEPVFLHVHVRPNPGATYTYTPINSSVGIDIPKSGTKVHKNNTASVQQVKTCFCFAFAEKRAQDVVGFICSHHPEPLTREHLPLRSWIEGTYEFISMGDGNSAEGLDFCEDHFDTSSWEIYSLQDLHKYRRRLSAMEVMDLPLPSLSEESQLLQDTHLKKLVAILPSAAVGHNWVLIYSTFRDGISLRTMYRFMVAFDNEDSPVVLVVRDDQNKIFGAITTCPLRLSEKFYGRGESSLFSFDSPTEMKHYYWTGQNYYFVKGNSTSLAIGSGSGHPGLWLDENFYHGSSYECETFDNKCLASSQDFICSGVEAWGFL